MSRIWLKMSFSFSRNTTAEDKKQNLLSIPQYLSCFFSITSHYDDLHFALHNHPPEIVNGVGERSLTSNISWGTAGSFDVIRIDVVAARVTGNLCQNDPAYINCKHKQHLCQASDFLYVDSLARCFTQFKKKT